MALRFGKGRWLLGIPAVAVAATVLVGCDSKAGLAAVANGDRITQQQLSNLIVTNPANVVQARGIVLTAMVRDDVFDALLERNGGAPSAEDLTAKHDDAVSNLLQQQVAGSDGDAQIDKALAQIGIKASFRNTIIAETAKELILADRLKAQDESVIADAATKANLKVSVNPRFGGWDMSQLTLTDFSKAQAPGNITFTQEFPTTQGS